MTDPCTPSSGELDLEEIRGRVEEAQGSDLAAYYGGAVDDLVRTDIPALIAEVERLRSLSPVSGAGVGEGLADDRYFTDLIHRAESILTGDADRDDEVLIAVLDALRAHRRARKVRPAREEVAFLIMQERMDPGGGWPADKVRLALAGTTREHSGDCTNQNWTCMRCEADAVYGLTDAILAALSSVGGDFSAVASASPNPPSEPAITDSAAGSADVKAG